ncbi:MAG: aminotransferase class V-fold PLP-dependent enzyme [Ginsengibacter sp.]
MNIDAIRKDTAGCSNKIFLNSAGSSLMPKSVVEKMTAYLKEEEQTGGYGLAKMKTGEINEFYTESASLLNCRPHNIAFAYNATDAYSRALSAIPFIMGDYILTTNDDYVSNQLAFLSLQRKYWIHIVRSENLPNGDIDLDNFEQLLKDHKPKLVAITHIPTNSGLVQQAEEIGKLCKKHDTWYLLDACQSVGQLVVDVEKIGCDFLSATGRKFLRGPRGTGFLYISDRIIKEKLTPLFIDMRGADWTDVNQYSIQMNARRFELWEFSYASLLGLTEAIRYANSIGIEKIYEYNRQLVNKFREKLPGIHNLQLLDKGSQLCSIVTFHKRGCELKEIEKVLKDHKVEYSVSLKNNALIDFTNKGVDWAIRFSPHYFNTCEEVDIATDILASMEN